MSLQAITVSKLNSYIKGLLDREGSLMQVYVSGEISNFSVHYKTGHMYFSLKDEKASIRAVMFASAAYKLRFQPENGMKVIARGRVTVFERDGIYQLYIEELQPDGAGSLAVAFEQLKKKLEAQGLFNPLHKKPIPDFPKRIGVITSPTGAAVQDIFNITNRRWPLAELVFAPVSVQGQRAPSEMISAIEEMNRTHAADVIIIGRGGGSAEDLWCFNDELLARAVYASEIPVISGVGHETDFTICDFVSDLRAPTPSAAAELATPDILDELAFTDKLTQALYSAMEKETQKRRQQLDFLLSRRSFVNSRRFFEPEQNHLNNLSLRLEHAGELLITDNRKRTDRAVTSLQALNPLSVLLRGYSVTYLNQKIVTDVNVLKPDDEMKTKTANGTVLSRVITVTESKKNG